MEIDEKISFNSVVKSTHKGNVTVYKVFMKDGRRAIQGIKHLKMDVSFLLCMTEEQIGGTLYINECLSENTFIVKCEYILNQSYKLDYYQAKLKFHSIEKARIKIIR